MRFGIKFRTAEIESARTVGDVADLTARKYGIM
jgi:acyl carrier protein